MRKQPPEQEAPDKSVTKSDESPFDRHRVTQKVLSEQAEVRPHDVAALHNQPYGGQENEQPRNRSYSDAKGPEETSVRAASKGVSSLLMVGIEDKENYKRHMI